MTLDAQIEAILFFRAEPLSFAKLAGFLGVDEHSVEEATFVLEEKLKERGVTLLRKNEEISLGTDPAMSDILDAMVKEDLSKDLGKATLETLTIVLYKGPLAKSEIDYVRGVNSGFILRNLLVRGLIEKISNPRDQRSFLYQPTFELLEHLGLTRVEDLPEYEEFRAKVEESINDFTNKNETL